jgi:hypothetical protein
MSGRGILAVELHDGWSLFRLVWQMGDRSVRLFHDSSEVAHSVAAEFSESDLNEVLCSVCDQQFVFAINRQTVLVYPYSPQTAPRQPSAQPLAIGAAGMTVEISNLSVWRDLHYTHPYGTSEDWTLDRALAANEYFLAGDNSPISRDGRHGPDNGIISQQAIVGGVIPFPLVSHPR